MDHFYLEQSDELYHFGVKGMKWGVRKDKSTSGSKAKRKKAAPHPDYVRAHAKRSIKTMSDSDLREANKRFEAERKYKDFTQPGRKLATQILIGATMAVGGVYAQNAIRNGVGATNKVLKDVATVAVNGFKKRKVYEF